MPVLILSYTPNFTTNLEDFCLTNTIKIVIFNRIYLLILSAESEKVLEDTSQTAPLSYTHLRKYLVWSILMSGGIGLCACVFSHPYIAGILGMNMAPVSYII